MCVLDGMGCSAVDSHAFAQHLKGHYRKVSMRVASKMGRVMIVLLELDLVLGLDVIRLPRHDGGRSVMYVIKKRRCSRYEQEEGRMDF